MSGDVLAVVMAGGMGERLRPLTDVRAKPAVPFAAIYRIVDFTLSNCINSGVRQIYVLTQYKSHSLSNHLRTGWNFLSRRLDHFIDEIPAQMQLGNAWYKGTADAIRQNMSLIEGASPRLVLVLSGDHVYKMDFAAMGRFHSEKRAVLTVSVIRVPVEVARGAYGVLEVDENDRIVGFEEKPAQPKTLPGTDECLASMGIYAFTYGALRARLENDHEDFGKHVIPAMVAAGEAVYAYDFSTRNNLEDYEYVTRDGHRAKQLVGRTSDSDYWRDVGTLDSYWAANLDLVAAAPKFNLYGEKWPMFNSPIHFPPAKFVHEAPGRAGQAFNSIVSDGVIVSGATVRRSILGPGIHVHSFALVESSILMGGSLHGGLLRETSIGRGCKLRNAIVDKSVRLTEGTVIGYDRAEDERRGLKTQTIAGSSDYVVVVPKGFRL
jgi:glucose-1-phosphate adenylyltransferase